MITNLGLNAFNPAKNSILQIHYEFDKHRKFLGRDNMYGAGVGSGGEIIITDFSSDYGNVTTYYPGKGLFKQHSLKSTRKLGQSFSGNTNVLRASNGKNWFVCNGIIYKLNGSSEAKDFFEIAAPDWNDVRSILVDRSGTLWFGRGAKGLYKITPENNPFISKTYRHGNFDIDILTDELDLS